MGEVFVDLVCSLASAHLGDSSARFGTSRTQLPKVKKTLTGWRAYLHQHIGTAGTMEELSVRWQSLSDVQRAGYDSLVVDVTDDEGGERRHRACPVVHRGMVHVFSRITWQ